MEARLELVCEGDEIALSPSEHRIYVGKGYDGGYISDFPEINLQPVHQKGFRAQWSPNGEELAIACNISGSPYGIFLVSSDGSNKRQILDLEIENAHVKWSPNGKMLLISDDNLGIHIVNRDGSGLKQIASNTTFSGASWSPNGGEIVYCNCETKGSPNLMIYNLKDHRSEVLMHQIFTSPVWLPFSSKILVRYYDKQIRKSDIGLVDVGTGKLDKLMLHDWGISDSSWSCSPNGKYIVSWYCRKKKMFSSVKDEGLALFSLSDLKPKKLLDENDIAGGYKGSGFSWFAESNGFLFGAGNVYRIILGD